MVERDLEAVARLRARRAGMRVVVLGTLDVRRQAKAAGCDVFLLKPFDSCDLVACIKRFLGDALTGAGIPQGQDRARDAAAPVARMGVE